MAEHNLIQAPEILLRLSKFLGLRQPHITPALGEVVQPVVVIGDVSKEEHGAFEAIRFFAQNITALVGDDNVATLIANPAGSGVRAQLVELVVLSIGSTAISYRVEVVRHNVWTGFFPAPTAAGTVIYCENDPGGPVFAKKPAVIGLTKTLNAAGADGFFSGEPVIAGAIPAGNQQIYYPIRSPIILLPGMDLVVRNSAAFTGVGQGYYVMADLIEVPLTR